MPAPTAKSPTTKTPRVRTPAQGSTADAVATSVTRGVITPERATDDARVRLYAGDCRQILARLDEAREQRVDLVFADPPFNWSRAYDRWETTGAKQADVAKVRGDATAYDTWDDSIPREDYIAFTHQWIKACVDALRPGGSLWINIPDDTAAEIVVYVKNTLKLPMVNWCIWHYRFGQNRASAFINSKVHALHFVKAGGAVTWNPERVLEPSDRATTYFDPRTLSKKDGMPAGMRLPMDVWYGQYWGRVQGNNKERRAGHDNQLPEAYLERVVLACSNENDLVLDPFLGSGTTGTVAHAYGRRFIGCEFSRANLLSAYQRITEIGMIGKGKALGQSTAIFKARSASESAKARTRITQEPESADLGDASVATEPKGHSRAGKRAKAAKSAVVKSTSRRARAPG